MHGLTAAGSRPAPPIEVHKSCGGKETATSHKEARQLQGQTEVGGHAKVKGGYQDRWNQDDQEGSVHSFVLPSTSDARMVYGR